MIKAILEAHNRRRATRFQPVADPRVAQVEHYHEQWLHQGPGNELIALKTTVIGTGQITRRERLGGLEFYDGEAA